MKNERKPNQGSPRAATTASSATTGGPMQGAAKIPTRSPEAKMPAALVAPAPPTRASSQAGAWSW